MMPIKFLAFVQAFSQPHNLNQVLHECTNVPLYFDVFAKFPTFAHFLTKETMPNTHTFPNYDMPLDIFIFVKVLLVFIILHPCLFNLNIYTKQIMANLQEGYKMCSEVSLQPNITTFTPFVP